MDQQFQRLEPAVGAHEAEKWTPWARGKLQEHRLLARTNIVIIRSETQGLVHQLNDNVNAVDLEAKTCSCLVFQENGKPCGHTITTIFAIPGRDLTLYMPEELSIDTWKKIYISNFPLIDVSDLSKASFTDSHPPFTQVPRGRPKKERLRSLQEIATTRSGLYTIALRMKEEGTSLVYVRGLTSKSSGDNEVANSYN